MTEIFGVVLTWLNVSLLLLAVFACVGVYYVLVVFRRIMRVLGQFMVNVPFHSAKTLSDLERRAMAINAFNRGDPEPLERYWNDFFDEDMKRPKL